MTTARQAPLFSNSVGAAQAVNSATQQAVSQSGEDSANNEELSILAAFAQPGDGMITSAKQNSRALRQAIAPFARRLRLESLYGCTPDELQSALFRLKPGLVHIQAHSDKDGLRLQDSKGAIYELGWEALRELILAIPSLGCVILNACAPHAIQALGSLPCAVITTPGTTTSEPTLIFTFGFYDRLATGASIAECYSAGCEHMRLQGYGEDDVPQLGGNDNLWRSV